MQEMLNTPISSISQSHRRKHSGELDVFEATRYFSGMADAHKTAVRRAMRGDRRSLDMPLDAKYVPQPHQKVIELMSHNMVKDKVRSKQPSSPGGKLASFLNSFFQQYSNSNKSKKSSSSSKPVINDQQKSNSRRNKRSSMSSTILHESKSCYYYTSCSGSSCGFRTPSLNNNSKKRMPQVFRDNNEVSIWGDEFRLKMRVGDELKIKKEEDQFEFRDQKMDGNGGDQSDSSSDLFELKINLYEFGEINSSGLPVYGSTDVGVIRSRGRFASTVAY